MPLYDFMTVFHDYISIWFNFVSFEFWQKPNFIGFCSILVKYLESAVIALIAIQLYKLQRKQINLQATFDTLKNVLQYS